MICSSVYRLFFIPSPPVQITRELQFSMAEFFRGRSPSCFCCLLCSSQDFQSHIFLFGMQDSSFCSSSAFFGLHGRMIRRLGGPMKGLVGSHSQLLQQYRSCGQPLQLSTTILTITPATV